MEGKAEQKAETEHLAAKAQKAKHLKGLGIKEWQAAVGKGKTLKSYEEWQEDIRWGKLSNAEKRAEIKRVAENYKHQHRVHVKL